tara:strand:+ start:694 stop:1317 length:624 start_codon:yes stop_codon:yes gene_type:complete
MAYLGNWPSSPGFSSIDFGPKTATRITETQSGRTVRFSTATSKFGVRIRYPRVSSTVFRNVQASVVRANGSLNSFDIVLPTVSDTKTGLSSQTVKVSSAASVGASSVDITSDATSTTILKAGDVVRFENHTKVYMVTADVSSDSTGVATMSIFPNLITALDDDSAGGNTSVTVHQVPFRMFVDGDLQTFKYGNDDFVSLELDLVEEV